MEKKTHYQEQFLDISSLPVVIDQFVSERVPEAGPWRPASEQVGWADTNYTKTYNTHTMPLIDQEENTGYKFASVIPREVENNDGVISEFVVKDYEVMKEVPAGVTRRTQGLSVDVATRSMWPNDVISTPEVLSYVEQLEKEKCTTLVSFENLEQRQQSCHYVTMINVENYFCCRQLKINGQFKQQRQNPW